MLDSLVLSLHTLDTLLGSFLCPQDLHLVSVKLDKLEKSECQRRRSIYVLRNLSYIYLGRTEEYSNHKLLPGLLALFTV